MACPTRRAQDGGHARPFGAAGDKALLSTQPTLEPLPSVWRIVAYRRLWLATVVMALANECERLAVGWIVLVETDSVFLTAVSFAVRKAPTTLVAPVAGEISDRVPRSRLLAVTALYKAVIVALLGSTTLGGGVDVTWLFVLVALGGLAQPFEISGTQGLITDIVPRPQAMRALALQSTGAKAVGALGSLVGGLAIAGLSATAPFLVGAGAFVGAAAGMMTIPPDRRGAHTRVIIHPRILVESARALVGLAGRPVIRTLLVTAFVVEVFGFAFGAVLPTIARDVLDADARGLGALSLMVGLGSVVGMVGLAMAGDVRKKGRLLIAVTIGYGAALVALAASNVFAASLVIVMGVGAMAALFDAIQWTLLQQRVPDDLRGRVIGGWVLAISFGWIGQLALGAASQVFGVQWALGAAGAMVAATGAAACGRLRDR